MALISIVTPTYNEEENIKLLCEKVSAIMKLTSHNYELIVIDNSSEDKTVDIVKDLIKVNKKIKLIINNRNYGHIRSPVYGLMQAKGDAVILISSDFQDPPELISKLIKMWEEGSEIVLLQKDKTNENYFFTKLREIYYKILRKISNINLTINTTGAGIFNRKFIDNLKKINDPYPYFRGLVAEIGSKVDLLKFDQPKRSAGKSKNDLMSLSDIALLGLVKSSKFPLRMMTLIGFSISLISVIISLIVFILKLIFWNTFEFGLAPVLIGIFGFGGFQILFLGILGEYIGAILTQTRNLPLVIEKERINFD